MILIKYNFYVDTTFTGSVLLYASTLNRYYRDERSLTQDLVSQRPLYDEKRILYKHVKKINLLDK